MISDYLDRPIAFQRAFVDLTGSVTAALMLSQAVYWSKRKDDGWFWKTQAQWEDETGLSRYEQETARKRLRECEFWMEEKRGIPAKIWYKIDWNKLDCVLAANKDAEIPHTGMGESSKLECDNPTSYYTETTPETTSETTAAAPAENDGKATMQALRDCGTFTYLDKDPKRIAAQLEDTYRLEDIFRALERTKDAHANSIGQGGRGILAPLAYMKKILDEEAKPQPKIVTVEIAVDIDGEQLIRRERMPAEEAQRNGWRIVEGVA